MKRPLFAVCICIIAIYAFLNILGVITNSSFIDVDVIPGDTIIQVSGRLQSRDETGCVIDNLTVTYSDEKKNIRLRGKLNVNIPGNTAGLKSGRYVCLSGRFKEYSHATNPGQFDSADHYHSKKIIGYLDDASLIGYSESFNVLSEGLNLSRLKWSERLHKVFPDIEASILCDLLLGEKNGIDSEIKDLYTRNGIAHILSISGLHVSIIGMSLYMLLRKTGLPIPVSVVTSEIFLVLYGLMTGMSISALRAIIMFGIKLLADMLGRTVDDPTRLSLTAVLILVPNPCLIGSCSFLLSFLSAAGVCFLAPVLQKLIIAVLCDRSKCCVIRFTNGFTNKLSVFTDRLPKNLRSCIGKVFTAAGSSLLISLSITLTTLPVILWFFYEYPVYGTILNLIILPLMTILVMSAFFAMLIPGAGMLGTPAYYLLKLYECLCRFFDLLPFHSWNPGRPKVWSIAVYYLIWLLVVLSPFIKDHLKKDFPLYLPLTIFILSPLLFVFPKLSKNTVIMLDVGQGDGIIYYTDGREAYLFDGGSSSQKNVGKYVLKPALKYFGLSKIDAAFVSHSDSDHNSGLIEMIENRDDWGISVREIILPECSMVDMVHSFSAVSASDSDVGLHNFLTIISYSESSDYKKQIPISYISAGDYKKSGRNRMLCLHPSKDFRTDEPNEASECFLVSFFGGLSPSMLLTGDVEGIGETELTDELGRLTNGYLSLTILKVSHHGSRGSTSESFLDSVNPLISLISAGRKNRYGHPHVETIDRLKNKKSRILNTQESGAIMLNISKNGKVRIRTCI